MIKSSGLSELLKRSLKCGIELILYDYINNNNK